MSNSNTEVSTKNFDVGEGVGVNPASVGAEEAHREKTENSQGNYRLNRQEKLSADLTHENLRTGNEGMLKHFPCMIMLTTDSFAGGSSDLHRSAPVVSLREFVALCHC